MDRKGFLSPVELTIIFLAASIGIIYLNSLATASLQTQNSYYDSVYTEKLMSAALKYKIPSGEFANSTQLELLAIYACQPDPKIKSQLDSSMKGLLSELSRENYEYIFYMDGQNDYKTYSSAPNACLDSLNPVTFDADTLCGKARIMLGTWKTGEEVATC